MKKIFYLFPLLIILLLPLNSPAATINVPGDHSDIQAAIDAATNGDTIIIAAGTYTGKKNRNIATKGKTLTIKSASGPAPPALSTVKERGRDSPSPEAARQLSASRG